MRPTTSIEELPDPIIEYILSYLSPYRDLKQCMRVNKAWYRYVRDVVRKTQMDLYNAVCHMSVQWYHLKFITWFSYPAFGVIKAQGLFFNDVWHMSVQGRDKAEPGPSITERYSHSACYCANSMYLFGGCATANKTFDDLWRLDLGTRRWIRPFATGAHPSSKACATLVSHCDNLVLFGGWTPTTPFPVQQQVWRVFNQIHVYNTVTNRWTQIMSDCPPRARHSATVHGDFMVVFGGTRTQTGNGPLQSSNDVWTLDLKSYKWQKQTIVTDSPPPRYGHSQIIIDKNHLLIMGGCGGPNMLYTDIWLLKMVNGPGGMWEWEEMNVLSKENGAPQLAFHPACKIGSQVVVLNKTQKSRTSPLSLPHLLNATSRIWVPPRLNVKKRSISVRNAKRPSEVEPCVNERGGVLKRPADRQNNLEANHMSSSDEDDNFITADNLSSSTNVAMSKDNSEGRGNSDSTEPSHNNSSRGGPRQNNGSGANSIEVNHMSSSDEDESQNASKKAPFNVALNSFPVPLQNSALQQITSHNSLPSTSGYHQNTADDSNSSTNVAMSNDNLENRGNSDSAGPSHNNSSRGGLYQNNDSGMNSIARRIRQRHFVGLHEIEQMLRESKAGDLSFPTVMSSKTFQKHSSRVVAAEHPMCLYVLDISTAVQGTVTWRTLKNQSPAAPEESILYSLVLGKGEVIMFGGIQKDFKSRQLEGETITEVVSNSLHFMTAKHFVI